jgi:hypothetical protein
MQFSAFLLFILCQKNGAVNPQKPNDFHSRTKPAEGVCRQIKRGVERKMKMQKSVVETGENMI